MLFSYNILAVTCTVFSVIFPNDVIVKGGGQGGGRGGGFRGIFGSSSGGYRSKSGSSRKSFAQKHWKKAAAFGAGAYVGHKVSSKVSATNILIKL